MNKKFVLVMSFSLAMLSLPALAEDAVLKGLLITSRDITKPQLMPKLAVMDEQEVDEKILACEKSTTVTPSDLPALSDDVEVANYREQLKAEGAVAIEPSLANLSRLSISNDLKPLLGQPINAEQISQLKNIVLSALNKEGAMLADIYVPPQRTADGYVVLVVAPAKVGKIVTNGQKYFDAARLACEVRTQPGAQVNLKTLGEDLVWLNRTPWRVTDVSYGPGENVGEADITLTTTDRRPFRPYVSFDNSGTRLTGMGRNKLGVSWGNPFGLFDHRLDYSYTTSSQKGAIEAHNLAYSMPIGRNTVSFAVSLTDIDVDFNQDFSSKGTNTSAALLVNRVLPKISRWPTFVHEGTLGLEYKRIENNLLFGQTRLREYSHAPEIIQVVADYSAGMTDFLGKTNAYTHLGISPGFGWGNNTNAEIGVMRPGAQSHYWYLKQTVDRSFKLPKDWGLRGLVNAQYTNHVLPYSERMQVTGTNAVRGYFEDTLFADSAVVMNLELQAPTINMKWSNKEAQLQIFAFKDWGKGYSKSLDINNDLQTLDKQNIVSSAGLGARFSFSPFVQLNTTLAWADRDNGRDGSYMAHAGLVVGY